MNPIEYLTTPDPLFGWIEWILFVAQIVLLLVGGYFAFLYRDASRIKLQALQRFGYVMLALGGLGAVLGGLKLGLVAPFDTRLWLALIVLFELALGIYGFVYSRSVYPEQVEAARRAARPSPARKQVGTSRGASSSAQSNAPTPPRPVEVGAPRPPSSRRESRRDRKRKKR